MADRIDHAAEARSLIGANMTIAEVEATDEYRVLLTTARKRTDLSPDEALQLAEELVAAAAEARVALAEDHPRDVARHGFDVDLPAPIHPECVAGKCSNCDGQTLNVADEWVPCAHACHRTEAAA